MLIDWLPRTFARLERKMKSKEQEEDDDMMTPHMERMRCDAMRCYLFTLLWYILKSAVRERGATVCPSRFATAATLTYLFNTPPPLPPPTVTAAAAATTITITVFGGLGVWGRGV